MIRNACKFIGAAALLLAAGASVRAAEPPAAADPSLIPAHGAASTSFASSWPCAFATGNGRMGALVMGAGLAASPPRPEEDTLYFSDSRLFLPLGTKSAVPDIARNLADLRQTIRTRGYGPAQMSAFQAARAQKFSGMICPDPFLPAFEFRIKMAEAGTPRDYLRTENFQTGEVSIHWTNDAGHFVRKLFISRADNVAVLWIGPAASAPGKPAPRVSCELSVPPIPNVPVRAFLQNHPDAGPPEAAANALIQSTSAVDAGGIVLHNVYREAAAAGTVGGGSGGTVGGYDAAVRIVADGGSLEASEGKITLKEGRSLLVLFRLEPFKQGGARADASRVLRDSLDNLTPRYDFLLARHVKLHQELFDRVALDLGADADRRLTTDQLLFRADRDEKPSPALLEKLYEGSRYALICAAGDLPPNGLGIWAGTWSPAPNQSGDYSFDAGLHLSVASALSCNSPELLRGVFALADRSLPDWQLNAKNLFGARGIVTPLRQTTSGKNLEWSDRFPSGLWWTSGAATLAHWYYDYYLYTGDRKFLAEKAFPFMKQAAAFYEDFLVLEPSGRYRLSPSYSLDDASGDNSTQEIMAARELLAHLIAAARELHVEQGTAGGIARWQAMLEAMPVYLVAPNGELQEWALPGVMNKATQRHIPHLYAIFQSGEFDPEKAPEFWMASHAAYQSRLNQWFRLPASPDDMNMQPLQDRLQMGLCAARFGEADTLWEILSRIAARNTYPAMLTQRYEDGKTLSFAGSGAIPELLNSALLSSQIGRIDLLPALPAELAAGEIRGLAARGQILINRLKWSPGSVDVELTSAIDQVVEVRAPKGSAVRAASRKITLQANQKVSLHFTIP